MKIICLSDVHLSTEKPRGRTDDWEAAQWRKLKHVIEKANSIGAPIVQAGDLCDRPRNWQLMLALHQFLRKFTIKWLMVRGQHDMYMHSTDSPGTVIALNEFNQIKIVEGAGLKLWNDLPTLPLRPIITGVPWGGEVPKAPEKGKRASILVIHAPIAEAPVFDRHDYINARGFAEKHRNYDLIVCGDIHRHFCIRTKWNVILNCGPMMRREATEYNFRHEPCFYVWDTDSKELVREVIPHAPAEEVLSRVHIEEQQEIKSLLSDFVEKVKRTLSKDSPGVDVMSNFKRAIEKVDLPGSTKRLIMEVVNESSNGKQ